MIFRLTIVFSGTGTFLLVFQSPNSKYRIRFLPFSQFSPTCNDLYQNLQNFLNFENIITYLFGFPFFHFCLFSSFTFAFSSCPQSFLFFLSFSYSVLFPLSPFFNAPLAAGTWDACFHLCILLTCFCLSFGSCLPLNFSILSLSQLSLSLTHKHTHTQP